MSKNIILVDKRVQSYETIISAVNNDICIPIQFDYYADTIEDIKSRIISEVSASTLDTNAVRCIGLVQHNYNRPFYNLVETTNNETPGCIVVGVEVQDPTLETWSQFRDFITWCKNTPEIRAAHFDMMACALYSDPNWKYIIDTLTVKTGVTIRASTDDTGAAALGGDWFLESYTGVNLKTVYFTEAIEEYRGILFLYPTDIREYSTKGFATGSVVAWGNSVNGGTVSSGVIAVYSTHSAFAALKTDGSVVAWGDAGGTTPGNVSTGVVAVYSTFWTSLPDKRFPRVRALRI